jgi:hypothetical protein
MNALHLAMAVAIVLSSIGTSSANLITNGDFSANASAFTGWPGYASWTSIFGGLETNPAISGWNMNVEFGAGVNGKDTFSTFPAPGPIVAFGPSVQQATPDRNWAFLQGDGVAILQVINVTPGVEYTVSFEAAGRAGLAAKGSAYAYDGNLASLLPGGKFNQTYSDVNFVPDSYTFTPTLSTATVVFQNAGGGGDAVNFTNVAVVPEPSTLAGLAMGVVGIGIARSRRRG